MGKPNVWKLPRVEFEGRAGMYMAWTEESVLLDSSVFDSGRF